jgi:Hint-domain
VYANDLSGNKSQYFRRYQRDRPEPVTIISDQDLEGQMFLQHAHDRLMYYHQYEKLDAPYTGFQASQILPNIEPPKFAVLSTWNTAIPWAGKRVSVWFGPVWFIVLCCRRNSLTSVVFLSLLGTGGAWHAWTETNNIDLAKQPFVNDGIYVVNEAFSLMHGWAEGSLKVADEILEDHFGVSRPWNFTVVDLNQIVRQTNSQECVESSTVSTAQESGGNSAGGGDGGTAALLCFTADALVEMADGTLKRLSEVQVGDKVVTGPEGGEGFVTETLVHPVDDTVRVAMLETAHGTLVGTPDHPVFHDGEWIEFAELPNRELTLERRHVDAFYNLEIDGHLLEESMHAYVVNGVLASGLGDNEALNLRFPRQKEWKAVVSDAVV